MNASETLRNIMLAVGLSLLLMMVYAALKFSTYDASLSKHTFLDENKSIAFANDSNAKD
jgi:hypothetical protein